MSTQFIWKIVDLQRHTKDGVVYTAHYTVNAEDGTYHASCYGSIGLEPPSPSSLIPYEDLTEEIVIGWVKDKFGGDRVSEIEQALQTQLDEKHFPKSATGTPWQFGQPEPPVVTSTPDPEVIVPLDAEPIVESVVDEPVVETVSQSEPIVESVVDEPVVETVSQSEPIAESFEEVSVESQVVTDEEESSDETEYSGETVLIRARNDLGQYIADDGTTDGHNEAWIEVPIEDA